MLASAASTACRALLAQGMPAAAAAGLLPAATPALYTAVTKLSAHLGASQTALFTSSGMPAVSSGPAGWGRLGAMRPFFPAANSRPPVQSRTMLRPARPSPAAPPAHPAVCCQARRSLHGPGPGGGRRGLLLLLQLRQSRRS